MEDELHILLRLGAAIVVGLVIGFNRDVQDKALGMRTLALVSMGAAIVSIAALEYDDAVHDNADALSRVIQGILQGVLAGIGFIGAGVILRNPARGTVEGLTTAATVWIAAALGIACALDAWLLVITGTVLAFGILQALPVIEQKALPLPKKKKKKLSSSAFRLVDQAHVGRNDPPTFRKFHPGLHLPADLAGRRRPLVERRGSCELAAICGDDGPGRCAPKRDRRAGGAKRLDLRIAVENFACAITDRAPIVAKQLIQRIDVVRHQRLLVAIERGPDFGHDVGKIDFHCHLSR